MKTIIQYIQEGYNTTSKLEEVMDSSSATIKRTLADLVESGGVVREGSGPSTYYRVLKSTPTTIEILDKMRLFHQQKSMSKDYRRFNRDAKSDLVLTWYVDTFPGRVDEYNEERHNANIVEAITQLEKEL